MASTSSDVRELATREDEWVLSPQAAHQTQTARAVPPQLPPRPASTAEWEVINNTLSSRCEMLVNSINASIANLDPQSMDYAVASSLVNVLKSMRRNKKEIDRATDEGLLPRQALWWWSGVFSLRHPAYEVCFQKNVSFHQAINQQLRSQGCTFGDAISLLTSLKEYFEPLYPGDRATLAQIIVEKANLESLPLEDDETYIREFRESTQPRTGPAPNIPVSQTFFGAVTEVPEAPGECKHLARTYSYYTKTDMNTGPGITTHRCWGVFGDHYKPASWYGSSESLHVFRNQQYENTRSVRGDALKSALLELIENDLFGAKTVGDFYRLMTVFQDPESDQHAAIVILATSQSRFPHNKTDSRDVLKTMIRAYAQDLGMLEEIEPQLESLTGGRERQAPSNSFGD